MATKKQKLANQQNALKSTGPKTEEGKTAVRLNALTHGLTASGRLLPDEDAEAFDSFAVRVREHLQPVGDMEDLLAERVIFCLWRLRRVLVIEVGMLQNSRYHWLNKEDEGIGHAFITVSESGDGFSKLARYEGAIERGLYKALHELQKSQTVRAGSPTVPPFAVEVEIASQN